MRELLEQWKAQSRCAKRAERKCCKVTCSADRQEASVTGVQVCDTRRCASCRAGPASQTRPSLKSRFRSPATLCPAPSRHRCRHEQVLPRPGCACAQDVGRSHRWLSVRLSAHSSCKHRLPPLPPTGPPEPSLVSQTLKVSSTSRQLILPASPTWQAVQESNSRGGQHWPSSWAIARREGAHGGKRCSAPANPPAGGAGLLGHAGTLPAAAVGLTAAAAASIRCTVLIPFQRRRRLKAFCAQQPLRAACATGHASVNASLRSRKWGTHTCRLAQAMAWEGLCNFEKHIAKIGRTLLGSAAHEGIALWVLQHSLERPLCMCLIWGAHPAGRRVVRMAQRSRTCITP